MAATLSNTQAISTIADMLGGLKINPDALKWASDVPVACAVMNTVAEQLGHLDSDAGDALIDSTLMLRSAFKDIALEDEELKVYVAVFLE